MAVKIITAREIREENELFLKAMAEEAAAGTKALPLEEHMRGCIVPTSELSRKTYDRDWRKKVREELAPLLQRP